MHGFPGALLSHLVTFMYEGEATVKEEMIEQFLDMGKELKIEGLYDKEEHSETLEEAAEKEPLDLGVPKTDNGAGRKNEKKTVKVKTIKSLEARARASGGRKSSLVSSKGSSLGHVLTPGDIQKEDGKLGNPDCEMTEKILQNKKAKMQKNLVSVLKRFESRPDENLVLGTTSTKGSAIANGQEIGTDGEHDEREHLVMTVKEIEALICIKEDNIGTFNQLMAKLIKRPGGNIVRCAICGKEFKTKQNALNHVEAKHISDVVHECKVCQQCLKTRASLEHHNRNVHKADILSEAIKPTS